MSSNNTTHFNILCHIYMHTLKHQIRSIKLQRYIHRITNYRPFLSLCALVICAFISASCACTFTWYLFFVGFEVSIISLFVCLTLLQEYIGHLFFYLGEISAVTRRWSISGAPSPSLMIMWCETEHHCGPYYRNPWIRRNVTGYQRQVLLPVSGFTHGRSDSKNCNNVFAKHIPWSEICIKNNAYTIRQSMHTDKWYCLWVSQLAKGCYQDKFYSIYFWLDYRLIYRNRKQRLISEVMS